MTFTNPVVCWIQGCYSWAFRIFLSLEPSLPISSTSLLSLGCACNHGPSPTGSSLNSLAKCALNFPSALSCSVSVPLHCHLATQLFITQECMMTPQECTDSSWLQTLSPLLSSLETLEISLSLSILLIPHNKMRINCFCLIVCRV